MSCAPIPKNTGGYHLVVPMPNGQVIDDGVCYEKAEGKEEGEKPRWVPCGKPEDRGLNKLNCEAEPLNGSWHIDGCVINGYKHTLKNGQFDIEVTGWSEI